MADKVIIEAEVKSNIGEVSKDAAGLAGEFRIMGVSLNGVKTAFKSMAVTAKASFATVKAGIMSTGIGALVIAIGSLISHFTNTKKGSEALARTMAGLGAVVDRLTDHFSNIGETIINVFKNPKKAIEDLWESIKKNLMNRLTGIIDGFKAVAKVVHGVFTLDWDKVAEGAKEYGHAIVQISTGYDTVSQKEFLQNIRDINAGLGDAFKRQMDLTEATQKLKDEEREFIKVRAQTRQDIQKARLDALDETKTAEVRLIALKKANKLELETTAKSIKMQEERIRVKREENEINKSLEADLDELAALEVTLIDLQTQSFQTQKRIATEMETLSREILAAKKAEEKEKKDIEDKARKEKEAADKKAADKEIAESKRILKEKEKAALKQIALDKEVADTKQKTLNMGFDAAEAVVGKSTAAGKAVAVARTIYNTQQAIMNAMANVPAPFNLAQAIATGAMGAAAIRTILTTDENSTTSGSIPTANAETPAPQMMQGAFTLSGGQAPDPVQAYVVTDEMTNNQNKLAIIRRRATI